MRNPPWTTDELIVTLDFYLNYAPHFPGKNSPEILEHSAFLNRLRATLGGKRSDKFRNPNGVYMKLMNFLRLDPDYQGVGLQRGNKKEEEVWELYRSRRDELRQDSNAIRSFVLSDEAIPPMSIPLSDDDEGKEGKILTRVHRYRERDARLVKRKKETALRRHEVLICEVCEFSFESFYGERGREFIECHHTRPLSELSPHGETTKMSDLALVCSNCHRMIHRGNPWLSIGELRELVRNSSSKGCQWDRILTCPLRSYGNVMPLRGGPSDKIGNRYEHPWTVKCMISVMRGEADSMHLDDLLPAFVPPAMLIRQP